MVEMGFGDWTVSKFKSFISKLAVLILNNIRIIWCYEAMVVHGKQLAIFDLYKRLKCQYGDVTLKKIIEPPTKGRIQKGHLKKIEQDYKTKIVLTRRVRSDRSPGGMALLYMEFCMNGHRDLMCQNGVKRTSSLH